MAHRSIFPTEAGSIVNALRTQRNYTLALYADLPESLWLPADVPYLSHINPPLWELGHLAWFQEYFVLRLPIALIVGAQRELPPSLSVFADGLLNSNTVAHRDRWTNDYPTREQIFGYMAAVLERVCEVAEKNADCAAKNGIEDRNAAEETNFALVLAHELMHQEALAMTLAALDLPLPLVVPERTLFTGESTELAFVGGEILLGADNVAHNANAAQRFQFDNESPAMTVSVAPFTISSNPASRAEFEAFWQSAAYHDPRCWSDEGNAWRAQNSLKKLDKKLASYDARSDRNLAAVHVNYYEAEAFCRAHNRRLPTEAEWEFAATRSPEFWASVGHVWEWTASAFMPRPGFEVGVYQEYSAPWFGSHQVLRGGSFATHPLMKYPQYRNFYTKNRSDMFCGFRTCAIA